jgi:hypothetical protein
MANKKAKQKTDHQQVTEPSNTDRARVQQALARLVAQRTERAARKAAKNTAEATPTTDAPSNTDRARAQQALARLVAQRTERAERRKEPTEDGSESEPDAIESIKMRQQTTAKRTRVSAASLSEHKVISRTPGA